ncbi:MAG: hypothetical protein K5656_08650 [Lachnospiraceae bacterium]|nr:hypothetical protein [Lachnospiraceae bacterium]
MKEYDESFIINSNISNSNNISIINIDEGENNANNANDAIHDNDSFNSVQIHNIFMNLRAAYFAASTVEERFKHCFALSKFIFISNQYNIKLSETDNKLYEYIQDNFSTLVIKSNNIETQKKVFKLLGKSQAQLARSRNSEIELVQKKFKNDKMAKVKAECIVESSGEFSIDISNNLDVEGGLKGHFSNDKSFLNSLLDKSGINANSTMDEYIKSCMTADEAENFFNSKKIDRNIKAYDYYEKELKTKAFLNDHGSDHEIKDADLENYKIPEQKVLSVMKDEYARHSFAKWISEGVNDYAKEENLSKEEVKSLFAFVSDISKPAKDYTVEGWDTNESEAIIAENLHNVINNIYKNFANDYSNEKINEIKKNTSKNKDNKAVKQLDKEQIDKDKAARAELNQKYNSKIRSKQSDFDKTVEAQKDGLDMLMLAVYSEAQPTMLNSADEVDVDILKDKGLAGVGHNIAEHFSKYDDAEDSLNNKAVSKYIVTGSINEFKKLFMDLVLMKNKAYLDLGKYTKKIETSLMNEEENAKIRRQKAMKIASRAGHPSQIIYSCIQNDFETHEYNDAASNYGLDRKLLKGINYDPLKSKISDIANQLGYKGHFRETFYYKFIAILQDKKLISAEEANNRGEQLIDKIANTDLSKILFNSENDKIQYAIYQKRENPNLTMKEIADDLGYNDKQREKFFEAKSANADDLVSKAYSIKNIETNINFITVEMANLEHVCLNSIKESWEAEASDRFKAVLSKEDKKLFDIGRDVAFGVDTKYDKSVEDYFDKEGIKIAKREIAKNVCEGHQLFSNIIYSKKAINISSEPGISETFAYDKKYQDDLNKYSSVSCCLDVLANDIPDDYKNHSDSTEYKKMIKSMQEYVKAMEDQSAGKALKLRDKMIKSIINYIKGKKKIRSSEYGRQRFDVAVSILAQYMDEDKFDVVLNEINRARRNRNDDVLTKEHYLHKLEEYKFVSKCKAYRNNKLAVLPVDIAKYEATYSKQEELIDKMSYIVELSSVYDQLDDQTNDIKRLVDNKKTEVINSLAADKTLKNYSDSYELIGIITAMNHVENGKYYEEILKQLKKDPSEKEEGLTDEENEALIRCKAQYIVNYGLTKTSIVSDNISQLRDGYTSVISDDHNSKNSFYNLLNNLIVFNRYLTFQEVIDTLKFSDEIAQEILDYYHAEKEDFVFDVVKNYNEIAREKAGNYIHGKEVKRRATLRAKQLGHSRVTSSDNRDAELEDVMDDFKEILLKEYRTSKILEGEKKFLSNSNVENREAYNNSKEIDTLADQIRFMPTLDADITFEKLAQKYRYDAASFNDMLQKYDVSLNDTVYKGLEHYLAKIEAEKRAKKERRDEPEERDYEGIIVKDADIQKAYRALCHRYSTKSFWGKWTEKVDDYVKRKKYNAFSKDVIAMGGKHLLAGKSYNSIYNLGVSEVYNDRLEKNIDYLAVILEKLEQTQKGESKFGWHKNNSTLYETMLKLIREYKMLTESKSGGRASVIRKEMKEACLNYIAGKESVRDTEFGRKRFDLVMELLSKQLDPNQYQEILNRINRKRDVKEGQEEFVTVETYTDKLDKLVKNYRRSLAKKNTEKSKAARRDRNNIPSYLTNDLIALESLYGMKIVYPEGYTNYPKADIIDKMKDIDNNYKLVGLDADMTNKEFVAISYLCNYKNIAEGNESIDSIIDARNQAAEALDSYGNGDKYKLAATITTAITDLLKKTKSADEITNDMIIPIEMARRGSEMLLRDPELLKIAFTHGLKNADINYIKDISTVSDMISMHEDYMIDLRNDSNFVDFKLSDNRKFGYLKSALISQYIKSSMKESVANNKSNCDFVDGFRHKARIEELDGILDSAVDSIIRSNRTDQMGVLEFDNLLHNDLVIEKTVKDVTKELAKKAVAKEVEKEETVIEARIVI